MKRRFAILAAAFALFAFLALPMGMKGQTRAEVVSYTLEPVAGSNNSYTGNCDIAIDGITWNLTGNSQQIPWRIGGKNLTEVNRPLYSKTAISDNISKIEVTHGTALNITVNSWTVIVASDANFSNIISTFTPDFEASSTTTINRPDNADWSNCYYKFVYNVSVSGNTNRFVQFTQAKFYKQEGSGPAVATPTFSPAGGEYITEQNVTISCETQGATIYYTTDDSAPDNTSTQYTTAIPVSSTTTIKAIAYVGTDASSVGTATYSIVQPLNTMQAIFDKATEVGGTATYVYITMNNWVVSGVSTNGKNVFVTDGTKGFIIYDGGGNMGFSVGDILSGTVYCKVQLYNGSAELTLLNSTTSGLSIATGGTVTAANIAMADLAGVNTGALVHYDNLTCSIDNNKYYLSDGTTTLQVYNTLYAFGSTFVADHVYNITGVYQQFNNSSNETKEVLPRSADDIEEVATGNPNITAEDVNIAYNATSGTIAYTIENEVAGGSLTATTESDWLTLGTVGTTVPFTCSANATASPRTASVTLTYTYNTDQFVTKNVTVTQAGNSNIVNSISDITAEGEYTVQGTIVAIKNRGFVLGDGTGYVYYYYGENFEYGDYDIGDMVKLSGPVVVYGGVFEFNNTTEITYVSESNYVGGDPIVLSGAEMDARVASTTPPQLSSYVQYEGTLTVSGNYYNITNIAGAKTAKGSISYPLNGEELAALNGKQVVVKGYYVGVSSGQYYNTMIGSVVESTEPVITLTPNEINVGSEGGRFGVAVTLSNITFGANPSFNIPVWDEFYEWIHFEEVNLQELDSICFTLDPNTTDTQRSFYFELRIIPDLTHPSQVYSNQVTVTQEAYVAPTYA